MLVCLAASAVLPAAHAGRAPVEDPESSLAATPALTAARAWSNAIFMARDPARLTLEGSVEPVDGLRPELRRGGVSTSLLDVSNRVWLGWGRAAFGVGIGTQTPRVDQPMDPMSGAPSQVAQPSMSVGWRYRLSESSMFYAGASAARDGGPEEALPLYRAKAGVEWKVARSRVGFDGGRLGLQLDSGYRMSIRTRSGGLQVSLRRSF